MWERPHPLWRFTPSARLTVSFVSFIIGMDWLKGKLKRNKEGRKRHAASASTHSLPGTSARADPFLRPAQPFTGRLSDGARSASEVEDVRGHSNPQEDVQVVSPDGGDELVVPPRTTLRKKTENPTPAEIEVTSRQASALKTAKDVFKTSLRLASTILQADPTQIGKAVVDTVSLMMEELEVQNATHPCPCTHTCSHRNREATPKRGMSYSSNSRVLQAF